MQITLYGIDPSPPVRATKLLLKTLGLTYKYEVINTIGKEHLTPEYLKLNPIQTVPTLVDGEYSIFDSHAINMYLVEKYGKDDSLYPKDLSKRTRVNEALLFDCGILFPPFLDYAKPILYYKNKDVPESKIMNIEVTFQKLNELLGDKQFIAGNELTIGDFSCVTTVSTIQNLIPGIEKYPKVLAWIDRCKNKIEGFEEINNAGVEIFETAIKNALK